MKIEVEINSILETVAEILVVGLYEDFTDSRQLIDELDENLDGIIKERLDIGDFKGRLGQTTKLYTQNKINAKRILLVGLGKKNELDYEVMRRVGGIVTKAVRNLGIKTYKIWLMGLETPDLDIEKIVQSIIEGAILGNYRFIKHKTEKLEEIKNIEGFTIVSDKKIEELKKGVKSGEIIAEATNLARDMGNEPANVATPTFIAESAKSMADEVGIESRIYSEEDIKELKMGSFLSVASGTNEPCKLVVLDYNSGKELDTVVLVGKGITFDSGGINLKSTENLADMKLDMAGAAAVIATLKAAAQLEIPLHIIGITPLTENMPEGKKPNKPGDIVKSRKGTTIEILNTDAEGRLILIDALDYANEFNPIVVIDIATLTGACLVALGIFASGLFTPDDDLAKKLIDAGEETQERLWRMPVWKDHEKIMESDIADIRNINPNTKLGAGASLAAAFLKHFTGDYRWAHIDIAGTDVEQRGTDYCPQGASGVGVRLLIQFLKNWSVI